MRSAAAHALGWQRARVWFACRRVRIPLLATPVRAWSNGQHRGFEDRPDFGDLKDDESPVKRRLILAAELLGLMGVAALVLRYAFQESFNKVERFQETLVQEVAQRVPYVEKECIREATNTLRQCVRARTDDALQGSWKLNGDTDVDYALEQSHPRMSPMRVAFFKLLFPMDSKGMVLPVDFVTALVCVDECTREDRMRLMHRRLAGPPADVEGDALLNAEQLAAGLRRAVFGVPATPPDAAARAMLAKCDRSGRGALTVEDFVTCPDTQVAFGHK